jgi:hypothetical protein
LKSGPTFFPPNSDTSRIDRRENGKLRAEIEIPGKSGNGSLRQAVAGKSGDESPQSKGSVPEVEVTGDGQSAISVVPVGTLRGKAKC